MRYTKYFFLGPGRTATSTLHKLFLSRGKKSLHEKYWADDSRLHLKRVFEEYDVFTDSHLRCDFKWLDSLFGNDALFVLNFRNLDEWLISVWNMNRRTHLHPNPKLTLRRYPSTKNLLPRVRDLSYRQHSTFLQQYVWNYNSFKQSVVEYFSGRNNFVALNVSDKDAFSNFVDTHIESGGVLLYENVRHTRPDYFRSPAPVREALSSLKILPDDYSKIFIPDLPKPVTGPF